MKTKNFKTAVGQILLPTSMLLFSLVFIACSQDKPQESESVQDQEVLEESLTGQDRNDQSLENQSLIPDNFQISINMEPTVFDLDEYELYEVFKIVILDIYEITPTEGEYFGANLSISDNYVIVEPIFGETNPTADGDNEKCGGQSGDGWKSYQVCYSEECVEKWSKKAAENLKDNLKSGQCLDIRIKRNSFNARVCGRIVDC